MTDWHILLQLKNLAIAYLLALPIGWERERSARSAGLRTFPLVALASCGFLMATGDTLGDHPEGRARIIEGIITGMGFIGGGAILKTERQVQGTATAASLWATGAIGVASALQSYTVAIVISVLTIMTLRFLGPLKFEPPENQSGSIGS